MACNKITYETRSDAILDIVQINYERRRRTSRRGKDNRKLSPYTCPICGKWHLTSRSKRKYD